MASFPGSIDNGATDTEYTPIAVGKPDLRPLGDVVDEHEVRIRHLERQLHKFINSPLYRRIVRAEEAEE